MRLRVWVNVDKLHAALEKIQQEVETDHDGKRYCFFVVDHNSFTLEGEEAQTYYRAIADVCVIE